MPTSLLKIAVIGSRGMLGQDLLSALSSGPFAVFKADRPAVDITDPGSLVSGLVPEKPALVINCAAYTAVDRAESESEQAFRVNRDGVANLADVCRAMGAALVHVSTDYVFDGRKETSYLETDLAHPLSVYGKSKWEGEEALRERLAEHLIFRTSWLFGAGGHNFVKTIMRLSQEKDELKIVADQHGCPTWTGDLSALLAVVAGRVGTDRERMPWGTYHFCGAEPTTWHGFAEAIVAEARKRRDVRALRVLPIATRDYPVAAIRPQRSVLDCSKVSQVLGFRPAPWTEGLAAVVGQLR